MMLVVVGLLDCWTRFCVQPESKKYTVMKIKVKKGVRETRKNNFSTNMNEDEAWRFVRLVLKFQTSPADVLRRAVNMLYKNEFPDDPKAN